jgi:hypothetical protein
MNPRKVPVSWGSTGWSQEKISAFQKNLKYNGYGF